MTDDDHCEGAKGNTQTTLLFIPCHKKIQLIRIRESHSIFDGITSNLPIMCCAYVILTVLATVFSMAWYKVAITLSWYKMEYLTCHLYFLDTWFKSCVYTENIQVTSGIFQGVLVKSIA